MTIRANISIEDLIKKGYAPRTHGESRGKLSDEELSESSSSRSSSSSNASENI